MSKPVRITLLVENSVHRGGLAAEHGLAFHIQVGDHSLLFDTGQTGLILRNARELGLPLRQLEAIVLSHGHYDHTGGVPAVLAAAPAARAFLHPAAFEAKYSRSTGASRSIGLPAATAEALHRHPGGWTGTIGWTEVLDGVFATGEIPRTNNFEDTGGPFFLDAESVRPDPLVDDQALVLDLGSEVVVLLGCAHAGLVNTLDHVQRRTGDKPVRAILGGMHLGSATEERLERTIQRLREIRPELLVPLHCTGWPATARLWQAFPEAYHATGVGAVFEFLADKDRIPPGFLESNAG